MRFFPSSFWPWLKRLMVYMLAVFLLLFSLLSLMALFSYSPLDPSLNSITHDKATNWIGLPGAIIADLLVQIFGLGGFILVVLIAFWAKTLLRRGFIPIYYLAFLPLVLMLFSGGVAVLLPQGAVFTLSGSGGIIGEAFYRVLKTHIPAYSVPVALLGLIAALFLTVRLAGLKEKQFFWHGPKHVWAFINKGFALRSLLPSLRLWRRKKNSDFDNMVALSPASPLPALPEIDEENGNEEITNFTTETAIAGTAFAGTAIAGTAEEPVFSDRDFKIPPLDLLQSGPPSSLADLDHIEEKKQALEKAIHSFGIKGQITGACAGPVVTLFEFEPAAGVKSSRIISHSDDIALAMSAVSLRIAAIAGRNVLGIELPNETRAVVRLRDILAASQSSGDAGTLPIVLGCDISGQPVCGDLAIMPHLLIAGTTGSGKSVGVNAMILSLITTFSPAVCRFVMIDPKMLELSVYHDIPHLLAPVVTDPKKAVVALKWTVKEMERRYQKMAAANVRNIKGYNQQTTEEKLPFIVVVIDEMADLMMIAGKEIEALVQRLAQMARASGIHLIAATQRPSVDVITGTIKANFPTRISYRVTSRFDSRTILGEQGAEALLGRGDMLFIPQSGGMVRLHGPFVEDQEVSAICDYLRTHYQSDYIGDITEEENSQNGLPSDDIIASDDPFYQKAIELVLREKKISTSFIQRHLQIGYNRAARIVEHMEKEGLVSPASATGRRDILFSEEN